MNKEINDRVKELRLIMRKSQVEFCDMIGIKQGTLSDIERKRINVTPKTVESIVRNLKVSGDWLYTGNGNIFIDKNDNLMYGIDVREHVRLGNTNGVNDGVIHAQNTQANTHTVLRTNEKSNSTLDPYEYGKKMKFFWNMVEVYDKDFSASFDDYARVEELIEHLSHYFTSMTDVINELYNEIQNTDNETLREPVVIKTIVEDFVKRLPSIKENRKQFNQLSEQLLKSSLIEDWVKKLPHLNPENNI